VFCFFSFKVVVPIGVGMALGSVPAVAAWRNGGGEGDAEKRGQSRKKFLSRLTEVLLLATVFATFCETFNSGVGVRSDSFKLIMVLILKHNFV
jgi:hypothetical protein